LARKATTVNSSKSDGGFARRSRRLKADEWMTIAIEHEEMGHLERVGGRSPADDLGVAAERLSTRGRDHRGEVPAVPGASDSTVWVSLL
jgi:hypothetical protein